MQLIADDIEHAYALRDEANRLLDESTNELYRELGLPPVEELKVDYLAAHTPENAETSRTFAVGASSIGKRLDASFHNPVSTTAVRAMGTGHYPTVALDAICKRIFRPGRFKRNYVGEEHGVPFIQGSHIPLMQPYEQKYLSRRDERNLSQCRVSRNWVLMTCSGTIGRIGVVSSGADGRAASQHLVRLVAKEPEYNPGYIALFLMTPYGQNQVQSKIYGAVVDELTSEDLGEVLIPDAPRDLQEAIGNPVVQAFELKDEATAVERAAIRMLENRLGRGDI